MATLSDPSHELLFSLTSTKVDLIDACIKITPSAQPLSPRKLMIYSALFKTMRKVTNVHVPRIDFQRKAFA
jgi:hypothetical protein